MEHLATTNFPDIQVIIKDVVNGGHSTSQGTTFIPVVLPSSYLLPFYLLSNHSIAFLHPNIDQQNCSRSHTTKFKIEK
jgi:hypothetical protein